MEFDERVRSKSNQLKWQGIGGEEEFNQVVKEGTGWNGDGALTTFAHAIRKEGNSLFSRKSVRMENHDGERETGARKRSRERGRDLTPPRS